MSLFSTETIGYLALLGAFIVGWQMRKNAKQKIIKQEELNSKAKNTADKSTSSVLLTPITKEHITNIVALKIEDSKKTAIKDALAAQKKYEEDMINFKRSVELIKNLIAGRVKTNDVTLDNTGTNLVIQLSFRDRTSDGWLIYNNFGPDKSNNVIALYKELAEFNWYIKEVDITTEDYSYGDEIRFVIVSNKLDTLEMSHFRYSSCRRTKTMINTTTFSQTIKDTRPNDY